MTEQRDNLIEALSKSGLTKYTDDDGKIHFTTKTPEKLEEEKNQKLTYKYGPICSVCGKRNKNYKVDIHKSIVCNKCYDKIWDETSIDGNNITVNVVCPYCNNQLNKPVGISLESFGTCDCCGTIYQAGFKDEFYYTVDFYKKKI